MSKQASEAELVVGRDGAAELYVDGVEFPWNVLWEDLNIESSVKGVPVLTVSIPVDRVIARLESDVQDPPDEIPAIEPQPWQLGWRFTVNDAKSEPPDHVNRVLALSDDGKYPVLARTSVDRWAWASINGTPLMQGDLGLHWRHWTVCFSDVEFQVIG